MMHRLLLLPVFALVLNACKSDSSDTSSGSQASSGSGAELVTTAPETSAHFEEVMRHLDVGGKSLHYNDHEGRGEFIVSLVNLFLEAAKEAGEDLDLPKNFDTAALIEQSSLGAKAASGRSISKDGDLYLLKYYDHYPNGLTPNGAMLGEAYEFQMPKRLPAATDIAFEGRIDGSDLPELYRKNAGLIGSAEEVEEAMNQPLPIGMTVAELLEHSKLEVMLGMEMKDSGEEGMPPVPGNWIMECRAPKPLIVALQPLITETLGEIQAIGIHQGWALPVPPAPGVEKPVLIIDGNTMRMVSSVEYLDSLQGSSGKLQDDPNFKKATNHFPQQGNYLCYISPEISEVAMEWMEMAMEADPETKPFQPILKKLMVKKPWSMCMATSNTGILTMMEMPYALDVNSNVMLVALGGTSTMFMGARSWKRGSDRSAVIMNIRNCQQAMRGEQNMKQLNTGAPFTREDLEEYMKFPSDIKVSGGWIRFEAGDKITPESGSPATNGNHIWLKVTGPGIEDYVGEHGFDDISDTTGW